MRLRSFAPGFVLMICCLALGGLAAIGQQSKSVGDEIIAIVKAQWAAEHERNIAEATKNIWSRLLREATGTYHSSFGSARTPDHVKRSRIVCTLFQRLSLKGLALGSK